MSEWIPLLAMAPTTLADLLRENGLPNDNDELVNIWNASDNAAVIRANPREPFQLFADEQWYVPPPPLPPDAVLGIYSCTGSELGTAEIIETIKAQHEEGADRELAVSADQFTEQYLLGLAYNQPYRARRNANEPITTVDRLQYPTRPRRTRTHDVSPSTTLRQSTTALPTGEGPHVVTVRLDGDGQVLKILDLLTGPRDHDPHTEFTVQARWRPDKVRFKITITPRAGEVTPSRVTLRVRNRDGLYFSEDRADGDWTQNGEKTWEWDGFTTLPPPAGAPDQGQADTRVLRGQLTVEVIVQSSAGSSLGVLELANRPSHTRFVDVHANLAASEIKGYAYVTFHHAGEDEGLWLTTMLASLVVAGCVVGAIAVDMANQPSLTPEQEENYAIMMGASGGAILGLGAIMGLVFALPRLSDADFDQCRGFILRGIQKHWSRNVDVDGRSYRFTADAIIDERHYPVRFALMQALPDQRACNLIPVLGSIIFPYSPDSAEYTKDTGAHEFGHSIMVRAYQGDSDWSLHHKGSTDVVQNTRAAGTSGFDQGFAVPPPPAPRDLMIYYDEQAEPLSDYERTFAAPMEVLAWIEIAQIEFREM